MATLYITEYATTVLNVGGQQVQIPLEPPLTEQTVSIGGAATASNSFNPVTTFVRLHTDAICSVLFGTAPVATTASGRLNASQTEFRGVGQYLGQLKVSVISNV